MQKLRFTAVAAMAVLLGGHSALALQVDDSTATNRDSASRLSDPDDAIPFPHVSDDGQMTSSANFQAQPGSGYSNSGPGAFERAQQNMQQ